VDEIRFYILVDASGDRSMKNLDDVERANVFVERKPDLERRIWGALGNDKAGIFHLYAKRDQPILIIASALDGWDHVSASLRDRVPTYAEMQLIFRAFFQDDETAMQVHVPASDHINFAENCLHLWRPHKGSIPLPPKRMV